MTLEPFTVSMCVYSKDNAKWFERSIESISINQTVRPNEIVLVVDGPIGKQLERIIERFLVELPTIGISFKICRFDVNKGHGEARREGLNQATNNIVALMDSDDISRPNRFEKQIAFFSKDPLVSVVGGQVSEFVSEPGDLNSLRRVPSRDKEIKAYLKKRCPFNQPTVMFKKNDVV